MQDWIFGCDICQDVCPYNRTVAENEIWPELQPERMITEGGLSLKEILRCRTEEAFLERFAGTPLIRAKREGLLRNAAIAAGNSGDPSYVEILGDALAHDPSPLVRQHAAWALGRIASLNPPSA